MTIAVLAAALAAVILVHRYIVWRFEAWRERQGQCEAEGHIYSSVGDVCGDPHLPARRCERCGHTDNLSRCQACRCLVTRTPPYHVVDEEGVSTGDNGVAGL